MNNQNKLRLEFYNILIANGINCEIVNDNSSRLDISIKLYCDDESRLNRIQKNFTKGIVGIFWEKTDENHKVEYLGHNIDKFDGYEVFGKWIPVTKENVVDVINNDIEKFKNHIDKHIERFGLPK